MRAIYVTAVRLRCVRDPRTPRLREAWQNVEQKIAQRRAWMAQPRSLPLFGART